MLSSRDAFGTPHPTDAIDPCGAAIFIILMRDVAVCSKAHSRSGFAGTARDTRRRARRGSVAMCGSTHRRGRCFFIIDSSWRPAMKRGRARHGASSIAWCRPEDAISPCPVKIARAPAACTRESARCRSRVCTAVVIFRRAGFGSRRAGWRSREEGHRAAPHDARAGLLNPGRSAGMPRKRLRGAMLVITACNDRAAGAPA